MYWYSCSVVDPKQGGEPPGPWNGRLACGHTVTVDAETKHAASGVQYCSLCLLPMQVLVWSVGAPAVAPPSLIVPASAA